MPEIELIFTGTMFALHCILKTKADVMPQLDELRKSNEGDYKKIIALISYVATEGPPRNEQKCRSSSFTGLFELKAGSYRIPFFYHPDIPHTIILTHLFKKCPPKEQSRELKYADDLHRQFLPHRA